MKITAFILSANLVLFGAGLAEAALIAQWTFEGITTPSDLDNSTISPIVLPETGDGIGAGVHASAASDWTTPTGNGSANSFSVNNWTVGDYFQFSVSTIGFSGILLSWDQISSGTGPGDFILQYSTDGTAFTTFGGPYTVLENAGANAWDPDTASGASSYVRDLSGITALDNDADIYFRLTANSTLSANGGTVAGTGTDRVDNFTIAAVVPEPKHYALFCALGLLAIIGGRAWLDSRRARSHA